MTIIHEIQLDLVSQEQTPRITVKQGEAYSRRVAITLTADGEAWVPPQEASVLIRYHAHDPEGVDAKGIYDTLPDGTAAWEVSDNTLTVTLVPQMLAKRGLVTADVVFWAGEELLATASFEIYVNRTPAEGTEAEDQNYYKVASLETLDQWIYEIERELDEMWEEKLDCCNGVARGNIDMAQYRLMNLPDPASGGDAVSLDYLEQSQAIQGRVEVIREYTLEEEDYSATAYIPDMYRYDRLSVMMNIVGTPGNTQACALQMRVNDEGPVAYIEGAVGTSADQVSQVDIELFADGHFLASSRSAGEDGQEEVRYNFGRFDLDLNDGVENIWLWVDQDTGKLGAGTWVKILGIRA